MKAPSTRARSPLPLVASLLLLGAATSSPLELPALPYSYTDLAPYISERVLRAHHLGHHAAYTAKTNALLLALPRPLFKLGLDALLRDPSVIPQENRTALINQGGGYVNHALFFANLAPPAKGGGVFLPDTPFAIALLKQFPSLEVFKEAVTSVASTVFGSGWVWLVLRNRPSGAAFFSIETTANQDAVSAGGTVLLALDLWEHAWSPDYPAARGEYMDRLFFVVSWLEVEARFDAAVARASDEL